jgi:hypothetical protein
VVAHVSVGDVGPLEEGTHLLHIGPQKTGSTSLQFAMNDHRETLREHGVVYPGPDVRPRYALGAGLGYATPRGGRRPSKPAWKDLLRQVADPTARVVCVSHEAFGRATDAQIEKTVATLGGSRPHVLAVARRYDRLLPSQWQQRIKARLTLSYDEWLRIVLGPAAPDDGVWRNVWTPHDTVSLARRWADVVGPDNVTVLVADDADRTMLPTVVERMLGVPTGLLAPGDAIVNRSLTYSEVELLRTLNLHFEERGYSDQHYHRIVNRGLIRTWVTSERDPDDPSIPPLPAWAWEPLVERSEARVRGLADLGVRVVGDPAGLLLTAPASVDDRSDDAPASLRVPFGIVARAFAGLTDGACRERAPSAHADDVDHAPLEREPDEESDGE